LSVLVHFYSRFCILKINLNTSSRRRKQKQSEETLVDLVEVKDSASDFLEDNQKTILGVLAGLIILVGGYIFYNQFVQAPKEKDAASQMVQAQAMFERDSFALALTNPGGGFMGFLDIIDDFGGTTVANSAQYYAGISYLQLGQYDAAIDYLGQKRTILIMHFLIIKKQQMQVIMKF